MLSLWKKEPEEGTKEKEGMTDIPDDFPEHWDVIVIGAGMAGILTAYFLQRQGKRVLVLEAKEVASGQTERTTAKITSQHDLKYDRLIKTVGLEKAGIYAHANEKAIREYERLIREEKIDCQFEKAPAYLYTRTQAGISALKRETEAAARLGIDAYMTTDTELPFAVTGALAFRNQAHFFPLRFAHHLAKKLSIVEHAQVTHIKGSRVVLTNCAFTADKIVVATHYPTKNVPGFYFLRQHQERSYVLALSGCQKIEGMYLGIDRDGLSLRQAGEYLLLGGGSHRTGKNKMGDAYPKLMSAAQEYFPGYREAARWSAQDCMPHDGIPFIGKYSVFTPDLYVISGFQKWGMTSSMVAAMILRDELSGLKSPYQRAFTPQRLNVRAGTWNFLKDVGISTAGLVGGMFASPRCAHMGCRLSWNADEGVYECPCHGSGFDASGKLLDNPSKKDLSMPSN